MYDPRDPDERALHEADERDAEHHDALDALDRLHAHAPHTSIAAGAPVHRPAEPPGPAPTPAAVDSLAHVEQPSERERREHRTARLAAEDAERREQQAAADAWARRLALARERKVRDSLYGHRRSIDVAPRSCPIHDDDAPEAA